MAMGLVDYASDSDQASSSPAVAKTKRNSGVSGGQATPKRRKLPSLSTAFARDDHVDDPSEHQGRTRSRPFVSGEYNAHLYIELELSKALDDLLQQVIDVASTLCPQYAIHSLLRASIVPFETDGTSSAGVMTRRLPLHVSLTHPLPLRRDRIAPFKSSLNTNMHNYLRARRQGGPLKLSLAKDITSYVNGRRHGGEGSGGRAFLAVMIAAGSHLLEDMVEKVIHPILDKLHLPRYHSNPEFHASFAWCLLDSSSASKSTENEDAQTEGGNAPDASRQSVDCPTPFEATLLAKLNEAFNERLIRVQPPGGWDIKHLELKIAKDIHRIPLS